MTSCRNICFTINNPGPDELNSILEWDQLTYVVAGNEICPTTQTPHLQCYAEFKSPKKFTTIKEKLPRAHIERRRGTAQEAADYCKKDGDYIEQGEISRQGRRTDISQAADMILSGAKMKEVAIENPAVYIKYHKGLHAFKAIIQDERTEPPEVIVLVGKTGTGKSRQAREMTVDPYVWCPQQGQWFDGYEGQDHTIFEEFRGQFPLGMILSVLDRYCCRVQYKGGSIQFRSSKIVITSPVHPTQWYESIGEDKIDQLLRRITEIKMLG